MEQRTIGGGGPGVLSLLGIAFIILKLTGVIGWSWLWVLAPFWIPWAVVLLVLALFLVAKGVLAILDSRARKKRMARQNELREQRRIGP